MEESRFSNLCSDQNIQQWLEEVFQENVPSFDENPAFIDALKIIMSENETAEKDAKALIKAGKNMKDFYDGKTKELQLITDFIQLNSETCRKVESLASVAEKMKLKEPSLSNFLLAMNEIEDREFKKVEKNFLDDHHIKVFSKKIDQTVKMNEKLRRCLKSLAEVVEMQQKCYFEFDQCEKYFTAKTDNLSKIIASNKESLDEANYSEEIRHSVLVKEAQQLQELEEQVKTLESKLQMYNSLPPNMSETARIVSQKEVELMKLEAELKALLKLSETA